MHVTVDPALRVKCPGVALACVTADVIAGDSPSALIEEMQTFEARLRKLPDARAPLEDPQILATRAAYKALGKDPARYRGSAEALLRRLLAGKGFPRINAVVDIINLVSVESRLSVGLYDRAKLEGDVVFRRGRAGESYKGIGKYDLNLEGLPVFCDGAGPHGSPTSDSERTRVTSATRHVLAMIISFSGSAVLDPWARRMSELFTQHASGQNVRADFPANT